jgi:CBS domain-containing protein
VTDRDLRDVFPSVFDATSAEGGRARAQADPSKIPVEDVMTHDVLTLAPGTLLSEAARLMRRERIGALPIVDRGRLVGILTRSDVLDALTELSQGAIAAG